ncbi:MAG: amidase [Limimaricola sp.]|uniref:amidase n=1 Tax=Limimaricola sp. TaxID=2211665 RepID=UPI001D1F6E63|nr:amidase family protein [Limimaricola sp.]MBI1416994.1 amidase [Limimaricola sp.]
MQEWLWASAAELGRGIGAGRIDPVALTQTYLDAIAAHPMTPRIYARVTAERALAEARAAAARAASGLRRGPLDGVPVSWKDNFDTTGIATEAGTALMAGRRPDRDAQVLANATAAGLVCLGKTHMSEIAFSGLGYNPTTATPPCINDAEAVPGGSSSGAAASVAHGLAAAAVGSDTGGSVRIPAAWNDLVGLKTTHGRLSLEGVVPLCLTFDTVGPLTRTVEDAALMLSALEGARAPDLDGTALAGSRLMVLETVAMDELESTPAAAFDSAVARLERAGATIERRALPLVTRAMDLAAILFATDAYALWRPLVESAPDKMYDRILERIRAGATVSAADYIAGWSALRALRADWAAEVAGFDAVIMPTAPIMPPKVDRLVTDEPYYKAANLLTLRNTRIGNLMGGCALTLPSGTPSCGIMLNAPAGGEAGLLRLGAAVAAVLA